MTSRVLVRLAKAYAAANPRPKNWASFRSHFDSMTRAHTVMSKVLRDGSLRRPDVCAACRKRKTTRAHHTDYERPLDVVFLCTGCHSRLHALAEQYGACAGPTKERLALGR